MKAKKILFLAMVSLGLGGLLSCSEAPISSSSLSQEHTHVFKEGTYACEERRCLTCGKTIEPTEPHQNELLKVTEPTCTNKGFSLYRCKRCETISKSDYKDALGHDYQVGERVESACDHVGYTEFDCSRCESSYKEYLPSLEHQFDESKTIRKEPTCVDYGSINKYCVTCKKTYVTEYIAALGHTPNPQKDVVHKATCEKEGYTSHVCEVCGVSYNDSYLAKLPHEFKTIKNFEATCEHASYLEKACMNCGLIAYEGSGSQKLSHSFGEDGLCLTCHKDYSEANFFTFQKGEQIIPCIEDEIYEHKILSKTDNEAIVGKISKADMDYLLSKGVRSLFIEFGNGDENIRKFTIQAGSQNKIQKPTSAYFDRLVSMQLDLVDGQKKPTSLLEDGAFEFEITHQNGTLESNETYNDFAFRYNFLYEYDEANPATWIHETKGQCNVDYVREKGYRLDYLMEQENYSFKAELSKELLAKKVSEGNTTMKITFTSSFQNDFASGDASKCNYAFFADYKKDGGVSERGAVGSAWIHGGSTKDNTHFTHTFENLDKMDYKTNGIEMNFSTNDMNGKFAGHIYIESISFEGSSL